MANNTPKIGAKELSRQEEHAHFINFFRDYYPIYTHQVNAKILSKRIFTRLTELDMYQAELAVRAGISKQTLNLLLNPETCPTNISLDRIYLFSAILECTPHYLIGWVKKPNEIIENISSKVIAKSTLTPAMPDAETLAYEPPIELVQPEESTKDADAESKEETLSPPGVRILPMLPIPNFQIHFARCMKLATDFEFVKCICEIVYKNNSQNQLMERTKNMLKLAGFCSPEQFDLDKAFQEFLNSSCDEESEA